MEALTGRDTSFISIMEDSEKNEFASMHHAPIPIGGQPKFESKLSDIEEYPSRNIDKYQTLQVQERKPPKASSQRKSNVAVGGHTSASYNNLSLYGHKKNRNLKQT